MPIPSILAIDTEYQMTDETYQKTVCLKLDIDKVKFENLNQQRKENNLEEITLQQVNNLVVKGAVEKKDDGFTFKMNPSKEEVEMSELIHPLLEINISYFEKKNTTFLHLAPEFNTLLEQKNFKEIVNKYYHPIRESELKLQLGKNLDSVLAENSQHYSLYHTLLKMPLQQIENALLPSLANATESTFVQELEDEFYKYIVYIPENCFWELPRNMKNEIVKPDGIKIKLRYLNMEEIDETRNHLLNDESYVNKVGTTIFENNIDLDKENPFEIDLSTDDLKQNNSIVEKTVYPKFIENENGELAVTRPERSREFLLKAYFGINSKYFDQKIKKEVNSQVESS